MFFSRIELKEGTGVSGLWQLGQGEYGTHKAVWTLFGDNPDRRRDFLYRVEGQNGITFYTVSKRPPEDMAGCWDISIKPYDPQIRKGDILSFKIRANPVIARRGPDDRQMRHDVVMDAKHRGRSKGESVDRADLVGECADWIERRGVQLGAEFGRDSIRCDGYRVLRFRHGRDRRLIVLGVVDIEGRLAVTDPARFREALFNGVGHGKAFGCGLMMVRPQ